MWKERAREEAGQPRHCNAKKFSISHQFTGGRGLVGSGAGRGQRGEHVPQKTVAREAWRRAGVSSKGEDVQTQQPSLRVETAAEFLSPIQSKDPENYQSLNSIFQSRLPRVGVVRKEAGRRKS